MINESQEKGSISMHKQQRDGMRMNEKGFTLIELIMVIVILGILAVVAIPRYQDLRTEAALAAADGVYGAVNGAAAINFASRLVSPTISNPINSPANLVAALNNTTAPDGWTSGANTTNALSTSIGGVSYTISISISETNNTMASFRKSW